MKKPTHLLILAVALTCASVANASLTSVTYTNDGDGAINCVYTPPAGGLGGEPVLTAIGNQYWGPGHMLGYFETDTALDPTLTLRTMVDNDTGFAWSAYTVNVSMSQAFTISTPTVYTPGGWTATFIPVAFNGTKYEGQVNFLGGPAVGMGDTLDFSYKISFSGALSYTFCQEMVPVPEPGTAGLLALGGLLFGVVARRSRR